jgi:ribulose-phosphate 3-epimerase
MTAVPPEVLISASILNADFSRLDRVVHKLERAGVDRLHLDVMDGHFVDNLTFGPDMVAAFRRLTDLPLDVHLMISEPARYIDRFIAAEPQTITFHVEAPEDDALKDAAITAIQAAGQGAGLAISPGTPVAAVADRADRLDVIMVMTVVPGWGGQGFMAEQAPKIAEARHLLARVGRGGLVHVDGGISHKTAEVVGRHGIDVCIVGSALFQRGRDTSEEVELVRQAALRGRAAYDAAGATTAATSTQPISRAAAPAPGSRGAAGRAADPAVDGTAAAATTGQVRRPASASS